MKTLDRTLTIVWLLLVTLTCSALFLGEQHLQTDTATGLLLLCLGGIKAHLLVDHFMGLRGVTGVWRYALCGYAWVIFILVAVLAFFL